MIKRAAFRASWMLHLGIESTEPVKLFEEFLTLGALKFYFIVTKRT